jgi:hypothetical protein
MTRHISPGGLVAVSFSLKRLLSYTKSFHLPAARKEYASFLPSKYPADQKLRSPDRLDFHPSPKGPRGNVFGCNHYPTRIARSMLTSKNIRDLIVAALLAIYYLGLTPQAFAIDFTKDVEPILKTHCFGCHGEDEQNSQLRLDRLANMLRGGNSGEPAVVPGKPESSFLLKLVKHQEPGLEMPPDDLLSANEIASIEEWIESGARTPENYGPAQEPVELKHWSFQPLVRPTLANDIDGFIDLKLLENGLARSPASDRRGLVRRIFLVMLGLPPSPERVEEFVADGSEVAWESLVEEILASQHFGERFASQWLDLVRFGETNGFETNRERPNAWPYRDWVIESFNTDKPYDEFVRQQLAGDALNAPIGTSFLVAGPVDIVKGQDAKLRQTQRMNELDDMINTTGTAFLGLTTGCARCHNHKFDPISQADYYSLQAVFAGVDFADGLLPLSDKQEEEIAAIDRQIEQLKIALSKFDPANAPPIEGKDGKLQQPTLREAVNALHNVEVFPRQLAKFVRFTILATNASEPCIDELQIFSGSENVALASRGAKATSSGDFQHPLHKLEHINDGQVGNSRSWISAQRSGGWVQIELPTVVEIDRVEWARDRNGTYGDRVATEYRIEYATNLGDWKLLSSSQDRIPYASRPDKATRYAFSNFPEAEAAEGRRRLEELESLEIKRNAIQNASKAWIGSFSQPGPTHRLYRGEPEAPREQVGPDAIAAFTSLKLPLDANERERRLALANWIASPDNPLTARVIANRLWQFHFGVGIVDTPSDFGMNGTLPTHPQLLDYLASELIDSGWSLKHLHRLILMSKTWQQSSQPDPNAAMIDAASRLLWRFPPRRLEAESIRDSILSVAGSLDLENAGGPGFNPFEVEMENVRHYHAKANFGPEDWRRMIYMTKVRQEREHVFGAFDCPDSSMVVPQRNRSTTPLQALNLLNSNFVLQQAELFAQRLTREAATDEAIVRRAWQLCYQREPTEAEVVDSVHFVRQQGVEAFTRALLNTNEFIFVP